MVRGECKGERGSVNVESVGRGGLTIRDIFIGPGTTEVCNRGVVGSVRWV